MKDAHNKNEVDLLLRALARRRGAAASVPAAAENGGRGLSHHLDADELNAYAENVLPPAARARYTEHLADCDDCRGVVANLSQAAGVVPLQPIQETTGTTFWQKLGAVLSPQVIRVALPALVLTAVIGVGLYAWRQQGKRDFVAQNAQPAATNNAPAELDKVQQKQLTSKDANIANQMASPSASASAPVRSSAGVLDDKLLSREATKPAEESTVAKEDQRKDMKDSGAAGTAGAGTTQPGYAPEPKTAVASAAPPPAPAKSADLAKSGPDRDEAPAKGEEQTRNQYEFKNAPNDEHGPSRATQRNMSGYPMSQQGAEGRRERGPSADKNKKAATELETRTVAGRRFVRDGDRWVDTAYDSSKGTTSIARGSEQYRALIADEPAIQNIANQLGGVVIVVWKNKAYRIH